jgi:integrase
MHLPHHLVRSASGIFHFRLKVPRDLRAAIGLAIVKISLRTRDAKLAQVYSHALSLRYAQAFAEGRGIAVPKPPPPPVEDILDAVGHERTRRYDVCVDASIGRIRVKTDSTAQDHADAMNALDRIGVIHQHLLKPGYHMPGTAPAAAVPSVSLSDAIARYTQTEAPSLKKNTWVQRQRALKSFVAFFGANTPVASITRAKSGEWAESLIGTKTSKRTAANMVSHVAQLFKVLIQRGTLPEDARNPVKGVLVFSHKEKKNRRAEGHVIEPLPLETLKRVFAPENFKRIGTEHTRWAAVIGLYTGARVGEIAQIFMKDFVVEDGTPCLRLANESDGQTLKTDASHRLVPLHPDLVRLGLLDRIERLRKEGHERFFPGMRIDSKAGAGNAISKGFGYYLRKQLKVKPQRANGIVSFHSLRKNVIQELQGSKLPAERRRAFVGHEPGEDDVHEVIYMRAWTAQELAELFPGLTWGKWLSIEQLAELLSV